MSTADTRGFHYPLQAVMLRRQWSIDRIQGQLAAERAACHELEQTREQTLQACEAQAEQAGAAWAAQPDPAARQRMLGYLGRLRDQAAEQQKRIEAARDSIAELEKVLAQEHVRLSMLETHRDGLRGEFALGRQRAAEVQADAQWLTLSAWRERSGP